MDGVIPMDTPIEVECATTATDEIRSLIEELDQDLSEHYAAEQRHGLALDSIFQPHIRFFVAQLNGVAVGCGGVALFADFAEVKRMYVRSESRGRGVADAIIGRLMDEALAAGLTVMRLETGSAQHAAIRFYRRHGFEECEAFEPYSSMPPQTVATSIFFQRRLVPDPR